MARTTEEAIKENGKQMVYVSKQLLDYMREQTIQFLVNQAYEIAKSKGWHDEEHATSTHLALIHSEVSEALEADRKGDKENFIEELADICIRVFDLCGANDIDLNKAIREKMEKNKLRSYKHGGKLY